MSEETVTPSRLNVAEQFTLPPAQAAAVDDLLATEQWLHNIGMREIIEKLASADSVDISNGAKKLRAFLQRESATYYRDGTTAARKDARRLLRALLPAVFLFGVFAGFLLSLVAR